MFKISLKNGSPSEGTVESATGDANELDLNV